MALPLLDSLLPRGAGGAESARVVPNRVAFFYVPNGIHMSAWTPGSQGMDFELPPTLEPLKPFRKNLLVLSGLAQDTARAHGDGPGDHARAGACFLTGVHPVKTAGANIRAGVSVDQVAAGIVGKNTRFPSLELGCDPGLQSGNCDSGYSCAYSANISWKSESTPMAKEVNPRLLFERLFTNGERKEVAESRGRRRNGRKSILDFVLDDARRLRERLGAADRHKLEEYLSSVEEVEGRLVRHEKEREKPPLMPKPGGTPGAYRDHIRLLFDLLSLAFQGDLTRIATFMYANEGSNRSYPFIGVKEGHHNLSHHQNDPVKQGKLQKINQFHMEQFAHFLGKLESIREGEGTLLDHTMLVYGSCIGDGNRHNHNELPILLAGGGCGTLSPGRHIRYNRNTPLNNLYLSLLDRMDSSTDTLGDSTGRLPRLYGEGRGF